MPLYTVRIVETSFIHVVCKRGRGCCGVGGGALSMWCVKEGGVVVGSGSGAGPGRHTWEVTPQSTRCCSSSWSWWASTFSAMLSTFRGGLGKYSNQCWHQFTAQGHTTHTPLLTHIHTHTHTHCLPLSVVCTHCF